MSPLDLGILQRMVVAREHRYCGKEFTGRSRLSQGKPNFYVVTAYWYTVHGARIEQSICLIVIQQESSPDAEYRKRKGGEEADTPASSTATPSFAQPFLRGGEASTFSISAKRLIASRMT